MENYPSEKYKKAKSRVDKIKGFYKHLTFFVIINVLLIIAKTSILNYFIQEGTQDEGFINWLELNIWVTPLLWSIGLGVHALVVFKLQNRTLKSFKPNILSDWEEKQIQKYMDEEDTL